jgi:hypothetical protein
VNTTESKFSGITDTAESMKTFFKGKIKPNPCKGYLYFTGLFMPKLENRVYLRIFF